MGVEVPEEDKLSVRVAELRSIDGTCVSLAVKDTDCVYDTEEGLDMSVLAPGDPIGVVVEDTVFACVWLSADWLSLEDCVGDDTCVCVCNWLGLAAGLLLGVLDTDRVCVMLGVQEVEAVDEGV